MGIDGIIPGVAYTLLNSTLPSDQSFSVYLVKLLLDSGLNNSITPQLLAMAQSNSQWNQVMNQSGNNKKTFINRGGGIGFSSAAGVTPQAMTSSMLANQTSTNNHPIGIESEGVKKAFVKLMGSKDSNELNSSQQNSNNTSNQTVSDQIIPEQKKRKSRFSNLTSDTNEVSIPPSSSSSPPTTTTTTSLPGFVRATNSQLGILPATLTKQSNSITSTTNPSTSNSSSSSSGYQSKRSRWGYSSNK